MVLKWRVYQFLARMGVVKSKEDAALLARSGKVVINGKVVESLHFQVNPVKDVVLVNGRRVELRENRRYFVLNKPAGVLSTKLDILKFFDIPDKNSFYPVGRLDKDTSGLLIVTNDGRLGQRVLNPKSKRWKTYEAVVEGVVTDDILSRLGEGVVIRTVIDDKERDYKTLPAKVAVVKPGVLRVSIVEGKKRQVRLMCVVVGLRVLSLKRVSIAKLELGDLKPGKWREFSKNEMYGLLFE